MYLHVLYTINKDLFRMRITWDEVEVAAHDRSEWRQSVAQCIYLDAGWIIDVKNVEIKIKNVKKRKKRDKNKKRL